MKVNYLIMKQIKFELMSWTLIATVVSLSLFTSCQKSEKYPATIQSQLAGEWKLSDLAITPLGDGFPEKLSRIPRVNDLRLVFQNNGKVFADGSESGTWQVLKDRLIIQFDGEEIFDSRINKLEQEFMVLEQPYGRNSAGKDGIVYYAFAK
jgi:hypothetical protein